MFLGVCHSQPTEPLLNPCRRELQSYLCVQSSRTGRQTDFRIAILPVDVRGGSGRPGNQLALECGAASWPRPLYKYPYGFDVNTRQPEEHDASLRVNSRARQPIEAPRPERL